MQGGSECVYYPVQLSLHTYYGSGEWVQASTCSGLKQQASTGESDEFVV